MELAVLPLSNNVPLPDVPNLLRPISHCSIVEVAHLQEKSSQTGDASGGDPPMVKSERLGNSGKSEAQLERAGKSLRAGGSVRELTKTVALPLFIVECGVIPPLMVQTTGELSNHRGLSNHHGLSESTHVPGRIMLQGDHTARP